MTFLNRFVMILRLLNVQFKGIIENTVVIEVLLQMTLKKAFDEGFTEFNHVAIDGTIKKAYNFNNNTISKKETQILVDYYEGHPVNPESLEKLHKPSNIGKERHG